MLAQAWLYGRRKKTKHDAAVERHLKLPEQFNPHSSVAILNSLAERIVFTDDVPSLLYEMHDNKQLTYEGVLTTAKLPFDNFWLEYTSIIGIEEYPDLKHAQYGALVQRIHGDLVRMYIIIGTEYSDTTIAGLAYVVEFDHWPPKLYPHPDYTDNRKALNFHVIWAYNRPDLAAKKAVSLDTLGGIVTELIFGIFLVTQPKVYNDEVIKWHAKKQSARAKHGKPPLLEYRRIHLRIGKSVKRYSGQPTATTRGFHSVTNEHDTESDDAIRHRRYHKVMGHFRHYNRHDPAYSVWIEPHYRGDPALGITFTERDVTK